jgi:ribonuclease H2 subunit A
MSFDPETATTDWEKDTIILGIDEAGRGPVMGPMVYACAYWKEEYDNDIRKKFKFNDSKALKPEEREKMFEQIKTHPNIIRYELIVLTSDYISKEMLKRQKVSLNEISQNSAKTLIKMARDKKVNIRKIYVDTVGPAIPYQNLLKASLDDQSIVVKVEPKADATFECVSAASIVAKVTRDSHIEIIEKEDKDCGSGYPSDPKTKEWLKNNYDNVFGFGREVRFSWKTVDTMFKENNNKCEWEDYDSEEENEKNKKYKKNKGKDDEGDKKNLKLENMGLKDEKDIKKKNVIRNFYEKNNIDFNVEL